MFVPEHGSATVEQRYGDGTYTSIFNRYLPEAPSGINFTGTLGIYLGPELEIAFYRRWSPDGLNALREAAINRSEHRAAESAAACVTSAGGDVEGSDARWETTGFCTDLWWSLSCRLAIRFYFRDEGEYLVRTTHIGRNPPVPPVPKIPLDSITTAAADGT